MILLVLIIALALRLISINQSLWLDEADNVWAAKSLDFFSFVFKYPIGDFHPPGYFAMLWIWSHIFGFSEISVRIPSVFLGFGTVAITYLLGKELFNLKVALIGSLLLALSPLHVYYSQEARMYALAAFSAALSMYCLVKLIRKKSGAFFWFIISVILVFYSDYVAYLIFPIQIIFLLGVKPEIFKKWLLAMGLSVLTFLPGLSVFPQQILTGSKAAADLPGWRQVAGGADIKEIALIFVKTIFGRISFENKIFYGLITISMSGLYVFLIISGIKKMENSTKFVLAWFCIPLLLAILVSFYIPLLSYFRMIFILPAFYLLVAKGISTLPVVFLRPVLGVLIIVSIISLSLYYLNPKFHREDWRSATQFINNLSSEESMVLFEDNHVKFPFLYYQKGDVLAYGGLKNVQARSLSDVVEIDKLVEGKDTIYLFEYLVDITDPTRLLQQKILQLGFVEKDIYNFNGVGFVRLYQK